jgi:hypothetical protein
MLGGAMRQIGILGAAGLYALDHHLERLAEDHANAELIASCLRASSRVRLAADPVETNIVIFFLDDSAPDAAEVVAGAKARGVSVVAFGRRTVRAVTHLDVTRNRLRTGCSGAAGDNRIDGLSAPAFSHRFVVLGLAVTTTAALLATSMDLVHSCPRATLGFFFGKAAFEIPLFDVLGLAFLFIGVLRLISLRHRELLSPVKRCKQWDSGISSGPAPLSSSPCTNLAA